MNLKNIINDSIATACFSSSYPFINKYVIDNGDTVSSRNGDTKEVIDFKTTITNPYRRCVGNNGRDMNIFFLLAEAIWIFRGEKDVEFLNIFNSNMKNYSDDGKVFHAPYGFRLRSHGVSSFDNEIPSSPENNGHNTEQQRKGVDQVLQTLKDLESDPSTRRAVMQIWNADLDLGKVSKDLPCNDLIFLKIRDGRLRVTISNRSNDLHWGLTTNVFQFSFITELMSNILNVQLGTQTHNSHSLHVYSENEIGVNLYDEVQIFDGKFTDLYDVFVPGRIDTNFKSKTVECKLSELDYFLSMIISHVKIGKKLSVEDEAELSRFSKYLFLIYDLLMIYIEYKSTKKQDSDKWKSIDKLTLLSNFYPSLDIIALAVNFFASKVKDKDIVGNNLTFPIGKM